MIIMVGSLFFVLVFCSFTLKIVWYAIEIDACVFGVGLPTGGAAARGSGHAPGAVPTGALGILAGKGVLAHRS